METVYQREDSHQYGVQALTRSQQNRYYEANENEATDGYKAAIASIAPTQTCISPSIAQAAFENERYAYLTSKKGDSNTNLGEFWLASRCIGLSTVSWAEYDLHTVKDGVISYYYLGTGSGRSYKWACHMRPMVEIPLENVTMPTAGAGTSAQPYVMF